MQNLHAVPALPDSTQLMRHTTSGYQYQTIFSFLGFDGATPAGSLVYFKGKLYGTTERGGYYSQGTVFSVTLSGKQRVLHNFGQSGDGIKPEAGLAVLNGVLYGTTYLGGAYNDGAVFNVTADGTEHVVYSFGQSRTDGMNPVAGLTPLNGLLYGTTLAGGTYNAGTVFAIDPAGREAMLYRFPSYSKADGSIPFAGLIAYKGKLFGTTDSSGPCGEGTVFSITTSGKEKTIYGFPCKRYDGANPQAGLVVVNGALYGTTTWGGKAFYNAGTAFSVTMSGKERILFDFYPSSEYGAKPDTTLLLLKGALYGTTPESAANDAGSLYSITPSGQVTVLHAFGIPPDGAAPLAGLTDVKGTLYGTTSAGGGVANAGTVYRITP
ncbi:MAG: choice-of-anchor tandem repeat GloVer-containing protein [Candidatus Cybelea sp.]